MTVAAMVQTATHWSVPKVELCQTLSYHAGNTSRASWVKSPNTLTSSLTQMPLFRLLETLCLSYRVKNKLFHPQLLAPLRKSTPEKPLQSLCNLSASLSLLLLPTRFIVWSGLCNNLYFHSAFQKKPLVYRRRTNFLASLNEKLPSNRSRRTTKKSACISHTC